jgi:hypothetical protein
VANPPLIGVITNPNSKKNRMNPTRFDRMREIVDGLGLVRRTHHTGEIADVVRDFLDQKIPYWVADGGDGAFHWLINVVVQVLKERGGRDTMPAIMPTNAGTIDFLGRKCGVIGHAEPLLATLCERVRRGGVPEIVTIDSLLIRGVQGPASDWPGRPFEKIGFAVAAAGVGQRFFDKFYAHENQGPTGIVEVVSRIVGSMASQTPGFERVPIPAAWRYYAETVFEQIPLDVWIDDRKLPMRTFRAVNVGSIDINLKGVFRLFPYAADPGVLHLQAGNPSFAEVLVNLPKLAVGRKLSLDSLYDGPGQHLRAVARDGAHIDPVIDGELFYGLSEIDITRGPEVRVVKIEAGKP